MTIFRAVLSPTFFLTQPKLAQKTEGIQKRYYHLSCESARTASNQLQDTHVTHKNNGPLPL
jgi:hypothetical protein